MDWSYYGKNVHQLEKEYNPNGLAFLIEPYDMTKADGRKDKSYADKNAVLEVHLDNEGKITEIYYLL